MQRRYNTVDAFILPVMSSCRDLGIIINKDLSFTEHINSRPMCTRHINVQTPFIDVLNHAALTPISCL